MTRAAAFTAEIVRTSSRGLAGMASAMLYERQPDAPTRYGEGGFETWRQTIAARLQALASALEVGDPSIFADDVAWFRGVATGRGIHQEDVDLALECLHETTRDQLPEGTESDLAPFFEAAFDSLGSKPKVEEGLTAGSHAVELFDLAMLGDLSGARHFLQDGIREGAFDLETALLDVLLPAAREAGRRWHLGQLGVAAEHVITATLRSALHSLTSALPKPTPNGKCAFVAAVPGDAHDTGLVAFALLLEQDGWRIALAGADTPTDEINATAEGYQCDLIALSATLVSQRYALATYLARDDKQLPVLVGGAAVKDEKDAAAMGAQGYASDLAAGLRVARELVGLPSS